MNTKKLNLDVSRIEGLLSDLYGCVCKKTKSTDSRDEYEVLRKEDSQKTKIIVHHINGGKTTLQAQCAPIYEEFGKEITAYLAKETEIISLGNINDVIIVDIDDFYKLMEILDCADSISEKEISGGTEYTYLGDHKEKFVLKYFTKRKKLQLIGTPLSFFMKTIITLDELGYSASKNIIEKAVSVEMSYPDLWDEYMPKTKTKLSATVRDVIEPSMIFLKVMIPVPDYSYMLYPVLRGMESSMRSVLENNGIGVEAEKFQVFTKSKGFYILDINYRDSIADDTREKVEKCYNFYHKNRHTLFHASDEPSEIRCIENRNEAIKLLFASFDMMEELHE